MTLLALEINDAGLVGANESGIVFETEGIAWLGEPEAKFGAAAVGKARLEPDRISSRHWQVLDQTPLARPRQAYRTHADVVFGHLEAIWQVHGAGVDRVVFVLPGSYGREQLGMTEIWALTAPDNIISGRVLEKIGLQFSRLIRSGPDDAESRLYV